MGDLVHKFRAAVHKEATSYLEEGRAALTQFLKDLLCTYGHQCSQHAGDAKQYVFTKSGFLKAVEEVLTELTLEDGAALWLKMEKVVPNLNYKGVLQFISLSETEIRCLARDLRNKLRVQGEGDKACRRVFSELAGDGGKFISRDRLHVVVHDRLNTDLNERELEQVLKCMDNDDDGEVSFDDFAVYFQRPTTGSSEQGDVLRRTVVDIAVSGDRREEAALAAMGYHMTEGDLNAGSVGARQLRLWFRKLFQVPLGVPAWPIVDIFMYTERTCSNLVAAGYTRGTHNVNKGVTSGSRQYLWVKRARTAAEAERDALLDVVVTVGNPADRDDRIWQPPSKDYVHMDGNANQRMFGQGVFLWYLPRTPRALAVQKASPIKLTEVWTVPERKAALEASIKFQLRHCPHVWNPRDGQFPRADFAALFNKHDRVGRGQLGLSAFNLLLKEVGCDISREDLLFVIRRVDRNNDSLVGLDEYLDFIAMSEDEIDQLEVLLREALKHGYGGDSSDDSRRFRALKKRFQEFNTDGSGLLSRTDIFNLGLFAGQWLSEQEVSALLKRLDEDGDGKVDLKDFLRFTDTVETSCAKREKRVAGATEQLRHLILTRQPGSIVRQPGGKIHAGNAWNDLVIRRRALGGAPFKGKLDSEDFSGAVARHGVILSNREAHQLCMRINPGGKDEVDQAAFQAFASRTPRLVSEVLNLLEKDILRDITTLYRYSGKKHRLRFMSKLKEMGSIGADPESELSGAAAAMFQEMLEQMVRDSAPDQRGQLQAPQLRKHLLSTGNHADADLLSEEELVAVAQYVGADDVKTYGVNVKDFLERVLVVAEELSLAEPSQEDPCTLFIEAEDEEALRDLCAKVQQFLKEKAKMADGSHNYDKAFEMFDEDRSGRITLVELKHMLEQASVLRHSGDKATLKLMELIDSSGEGVISSTELKAFCERVYVQIPSTEHSKDRKQHHTGGEAREKLDLEPFAGKLTGDKMTDALIIDIVGKLAKGKSLDEVRLGDLQHAFSSCDPDQAGVITRKEFFSSLEKLKVSLQMDVYTASKALEFFLEDEDLIDYDAIVHAVSRLRHFYKVRRNASRKQTGGAKDAPVLTGNPKLDQRIGSMQLNFKKTVETNDKTARGKDPYRVFWKLDEDHDGKLRLSEFKRGLDKLMGKEAQLSEKELRALFRWMDTDQAHQVDYREFIEFMVTGDSSTFTRQKGSHDIISSDSEDEADTQNGSIPSEAAKPQQEDDLYKRVWNHMVELEPDETRRKRYWSMLKKFDPQRSGWVSERRLRAFLYKLQLDLCLSKSEVRWLIRSLDPDLTGNVQYARLFERLERFEAAQRARKENEKDRKAEEKAATKKAVGIDTVAPILKKVLDAINLSVMKGRPYHGLFGLSDELQTGYVSKEAFEHTLKIMGCLLSKDELQTVMTLMTPREDGMVSYEELYHLIMRTPGVGVLVTQTVAASSPSSNTMFAMATRRSSGHPPSKDQRTLRWGMNTSIPFNATTTMSDPAESGMSLRFAPSQTSAVAFNAAAQVPLTQSVRDDWGIDVIDTVLDDIGVRVRNCVRERMEQWGSGFSLLRQFEVIDPERRGCVHKNDFHKVLQQLGTPISPSELAHLVTKFDRYGDNMVDYEEFCRVVMADAREFDATMRRLASKIGELRKKGQSIRTAFEMFDVDRSGFIPMRDFREAFKQLQLPATDTQLQTIMDHFTSVTEHGVVSYVEFLDDVAGARDVSGEDLSYTRRPVDVTVAPFSTSTTRGERPSLAITSSRPLCDIDPQSSAELFSPGDARTTRGECRWLQRAAAARTCLDGERLSFESTSPPIPIRIAPEVNFSPTTLVQTNRRPFNASLSASSPQAARTHRSTTWMCETCYFAENTSDSSQCTCCGSRKGGQEERGGVDCANCAYRNTRHAHECAMCGEPLRSQPHQPTNSSTLRTTGWRTRS